MNLRIVTQSLRPSCQNHQPPMPVIQAMRDKFGWEADTKILTLEYDACGGYWYFIHAGMYHGIEPDGYIHT